MPTHRPLLAAALALAAGCAHRPLTPTTADPRPYGPPWSATLRRDHPLAGRILDVKGRRWTDEATLDAALARADVAVLGETHDNPDHHRLQAREVRAMAAAGRTPALAFEQLASPQQPQVDAALAGGGGADAVAEAVDWGRSGWPAFAMYRPVFEAGLAAGMPVVAANLSRATARELMSRGPAALPEEVRAWLARAPQLTPAQLAQARRKMAEDHCGEVEDALLEPLVLAQRARDAELAARTAGAAGRRGAILVAGDGHARTDGAVPAWLAREVPALAVVSVGHLEVQAGLDHPDDYLAEYGAGAGGVLPFDFVVFTPAAEREDPCARLHRQQEEKRAGQAPAAR